ncbi:MAG: glycosyltransferase family 39 protein [Nanoarchaeota archaeon]
MFIRRTFWQLLFLYFLFFILGFFFESWLRYGVFAVILGVLFYFVKFDLKFKGNVSKYYVLIPLILLLLFRVMPYVGNDIALGYDPGIYKDVFEVNSESISEGKLSEQYWAKVSYPVVLTYVVHPLMLFGFSSEFLVSLGLIIFELMLVLALFVVVREFFDSETALYSSVFYSLSVVAFHTFYMNYYKNIIGIFLMFIAFYLFKKQRYFLGCLVGGVLGGLHRPSFAIFGASFFFYWLFLKRSWREFVSGLVIVFLALLFYLDRFSQMILSIVGDTAQSLVGDTGTGTFFSYSQSFAFSYLFLPFALFGIIYSFRKRNWNFFLFWFVVNLVIVLFELFFYKRMIIFLNVVFLIYAGLGLKLILDNFKFRKVFVLVIFVLMFVSMFLYVKDVRPLVSEAEFETIVWISENVSSEALVFSMDKSYSPWLKGYSGHRVVAPGLFDENVWDKSEWNSFWAGNFSMISDYSGEKYVFVGRVNPFKVSSMISDECFEQVYVNVDSRVLKFVC